MAKFSTVRATMAKFSTLSLTTVPSLASCPTKLMTTFSLVHNQLQLLPMKFRYAPQQFNKGRNMRTGPTTITRNYFVASHASDASDEFPISMDDGGAKVSADYTELCDGLHVKYASPRGGDQRLKDDQKVEVKYSIWDQKRHRIEKNKEKQITVGKNELGPGFDMAIRGMSAGEHAIFVIREDLRPWHFHIFKEDTYHVYHVTLVKITN